MKLLRLLLFALIVCIVSLEVALHAIDPRGILTLRSDLRRNLTYVTPEAVYTYPDGVHVFRHWSATTRDGYRVTPASNEASDCVIAFVGDSFTFGQGVDDADSYPNQIAQRLSVRVLNRGIPGYGIDEIAATIDRTDADGYVYFAVPGDEQPTVRASLDQLPVMWQSAILTYTRYGARYADTPTDAQRIAFRERVEALADTVPLVVGYFYMPLPVDGAIEVPYRQDMTVSYADGHYNTEGNMYVADVLESAVSELVSEVCE